MKKKMCGLFVVVNFIAMVSSAQQYPLSNSSTTVSTATRSDEAMLVKLRESQTRSDDALFLEYINGFKISVKANDRDFTCTEILSEGKLGEYGKLVEKKLQDSPHLYYDLLNGPDDLQKLCPMYDGMELSEKAHIWSLILSSMAYYESTCRPKITAKGTNGTAIGYFQLFSGREHRFSNYGCVKGDGQRPGASVVCAASMLQDQIMRDGLLFSSRSYWEVLRPQVKPKRRRADDIQLAIKKYPACNGSRYL